MSEVIDNDYHPVDSGLEATDDHWGTEHNTMLKDRANRGANAEAIQSNRNSDLRTRSLRGAWNMVKDQRAREDQTQ